MQYVFTFVVGQGKPYSVVDLAATLADPGEHSDGARVTLTGGEVQGRFATLRLGGGLQARIRRQANGVAATSEYIIKTHNIYLDHKSAAPQHCSHQRHPYIVI